MSPQALFERVFSLSKKFAAVLAWDAVEDVGALQNWRVQYFIFSAGALKGIHTSGAHDSFTALWLRLFVPILEKHHSPAHIVLHWFV